MRNDYFPHLHESKLVALLSEPVLRKKPLLVKSIHFSAFSAKLSGVKIPHRQLCSIAFLSYLTLMLFFFFLWLNLVARLTSAHPTKQRQKNSGHSVGGTDVIPVMICSTVMTWKIIYQSFKCTFKMLVNVMIHR